MGSVRNRENPNARRKLFPKLIVTGRLEGSLFGHPVEIDGNESRLTIRFNSFWVAWRMRRFVSTGLLRLVDAFASLGISTEIQIRRGRPFELAPKPAMIAKLFLP